MMKWGGVKAEQGNAWNNPVCPTPFVWHINSRPCPENFFSYANIVCVRIFYLNSTFFVRTANSFGYIYPSARRELRKLRSNFIPSTVGSGLLNITHDYLSPLVQNTKRYSVSMCGFSLGRKIAMGAESTLSVLSAHSQRTPSRAFAESTLKVRWKYAESTLSEPLFASEMVHAPSEFS